MINANLIIANTQKFEDFSNIPIIIQDAGLWVLV